MNSAELIELYTQEILDHNKNKWRVIEMSDIDEIIQVKLNEVAELLPSLERIKQMDEKEYEEAIHEVFKAKL